MPVEPSSPRPPFLARTLLHVVLPRGILRESLIGDLNEQFRRRYEALGPRDAKRWYAVEALGLVWYGMRYRTRLTRSRLSSRDAGALGAQRQRKNPFTLVGSLHHDWMSAVRSLRRAPRFALVAAGTMAVGISATVLVFSVVDGVLLRPLPYPDARALAYVGFSRENGRLMGVSGPFLEEWRGSTHLEQFTGSVKTSKILTGSGDPSVLDAAAVSPQYFSLLGVPFAAGRGFTVQDDDPAGAHIVVISSRLWHARWASDPNIIGRSILLDDKAFTVAGVVRNDFRPPEALDHTDVDLWIPLSSFHQSLIRPEAFFVRVLARVREPATLFAAREELERLGAPVRSGLPADYGEYLVPGVRLLREETVGDIARRLFALFGAVTFLLLIACANVANLFLARGSDLARELSIRAALGASHARVAALVLFESLAVAIGGSAGGTALAFAGLNVFRRMSPGDIPRLAEVTIDGRVLAFAVGMAVVTGILFGLVPAIATGRRSVARVLTSSNGRFSTGREKRRLRDGLVVLEMASAVILVVGAGLLLNSFVRLSAVDPGFDPRHVETLSVRLDASYPTQDDRNRVFDVLLERARMHPAIEAASLTFDLPMSAGGLITTTYLDSDPNKSSWVANHRITSGYFDVFGMRLARGSREFPQRLDASSYVVVVNEQFASQSWPGVSAIGRRLRFDEDPNAPWFEVIGVVNDVRHDDLAGVPEPQVYLPYQTADFAIVSMHLAVRAAGRGSVGPELRRLVRDLDRSIPISGVVPMTDRLATSIAEPRFYTALLATLATVAIILAAAGIYSTMAYAVSRRTRELGIRMALGAPPFRVLGLVLRQGTTVTALGAVLGIGGAFGLSRILSGFLFGITVTDPVTFVAAVALLGTVSIVACIGPARKATDIDPVQTLRSE